MNQGKLEVVKQEMARANIDILGISELKWTGMRHGFGWTLGLGDGQGGLTCCDSWGRKESDMTE